MKSYYKLLLLAGMVFLLADAYAAKRALIVAIGNYDRSKTGWHNISSLNDIPLIDSILTKHGFTDKVILKDEQATRDGILTALKALAKRTRPGDVVLVHFSSHGQLIEDDKGENTEEAIVAWGAPSSGVQGYKGEKHLVYGDIKSMRDTLRLRAGATGDVILFFDACHSGGLTRGRAITRGGAPPISIRGWKSSVNVNNGETEAGDGYLNPDKSDNKALAPYVAISACKSGELNSEYPDGHCGSLSYALVKAFSQINATSETYSQLFAAILNDMYDINPSQHPVISGNIDRKIFAGQAIAMDPHFIITDQKDNGNYVLNAGAVNGLTKGTKLEAYSAGIKTRNDAQPIFTVTVADEPDMLSSEVRLDKDMPDLKYTSVWFYIKQVAYNGEVIRLSVDSVDKLPKMKKELTDFFMGDTEVILTSINPQLILGYNKQLNTYSIFNGLSGAFMHTLPADNNQLKSYLVNYAQCIALKRINMANSLLSFAIELKEKDGSEIETKRGGITAVKEGQEVSITFTNPHSKQLYLNVFNFDPDGSFELIKSDAKLVSNLQIKATVGKPYGTDMVLAIATPQPLYLNDLSANSPARGSTNRGALNSLQKIFNSPTTRGQMAPEDEEGFSANVSFDIYP